MERFAEQFVITSLDNFENAWIGGGGAGAVGSGQWAVASDPQR